MKSTLERLIAASLLLLAACGTPATPEATDCGDAESFEANGNTYCVASRAIIEKGFSCPMDMFGLEFGEVTVCSPSGDIPVPDQGPLYEYAQGQGGTGDPLQVCNGEDPSAQGCDADSDCAAGQTCQELDTTECRSSACFCDPTEGNWTCTGDCLPARACVQDTAPATCEGPDPSEQECDVDADCAAGQACVELDTAVCVPSSCFCGEGDTTWGCTEDCNSERACQATPSQTCASDADCPDDHLCGDGVCSPFEPLECTTDEDCGANELCNADTSECEADPNACVSDDDCATGQTCLSGICSN